MNMVSFKCILADSISTNKYKIFIYEKNKQKISKCTDCYGKVDLYLKKGVYKAFIIPLFNLNLNCIMSSFIVRDEKINLLFTFNRNTIIPLVSINFNLIDKNYPNIPMKGEIKLWPDHIL